MDFIRRLFRSCILICIFQLRSQIQAGEKILGDILLDIYPIQFARSNDGVTFYGEVDSSQMLMLGFAINASEIADRYQKAYEWGRIQQPDTTIANVTFIGKCKLDQHVHYFPNYS